MSRTLTCSVELSKSAGVTLTVTDEGGRIIQTVVMNGVTICATVKSENGHSTITQGAGDIELEVEGPQAKSTLRQTQDRVFIRCRSLEVEADEIQMKSSGDTRHEASGKMTFNSTGTMALATSGQCSISSTGDMKLDAQASLTAVAAMNAKLSGNITKVEAANQLSANGGVAVAISAPKIDASATIKLDLSAVQTVLRGDAAAIVRGSLIKLEGGLIKLG